jgi:hypothetical protein
LFSFFFFFFFVLFFVIWTSQDTQLRRWLRLAAQKRTARALDWTAAERATPAPLNKKTLKTTTKTKQKLKQTKKNFFYNVDVWHPRRSFLVVFSSSCNNRQTSNTNSNGLFRVSEVRNDGRVFAAIATKEKCTMATVMTSFEQRKSSVASIARLAG